MDAETVAWIAAAGTAVGALIGSASGGAVEFGLERLRQGRLARIGARLLRVELAFAASLIKLVENDSKWWVYYDMEMPAWEKYQDPLAGRLNAEEFEAVAQSVGELRELWDKVRKAPRPEGRQYWTLGDDSVSSAHVLREHATEAYNALARVAKQERIEGCLLHDD